MKSAIIQQVQEENREPDMFLEVPIIETENLNQYIQFDIEVNKVINGIDALGLNFLLLDSKTAGTSIIRFSVHKSKNEDEDDDGSPMTVVPFQIAYAVSIHKAQGLEYESVKLVISDAVDELITHNIFYTAITRTQSELKIYWTPEVEKKVLSRIKPLNNRKDISLFRCFYSK